MDERGPCGRSDRCLGVVTSMTEWGDEGPDNDDWVPWIIGAMVVMLVVLSLVDAF